MKRFLSVALIICFVLLSFCSCGETEQTVAVELKSSDIAGEWHTVEKLEDISALKEKLSQNGFFDEELALITADNLSAEKILTFTGTDEKSGAYSYTYDKDETYVYLTMFAEDFIKKCYDNFDAIKHNYTESMTADISSFEDFKQFYCSNFSCAGYDELIDKICGLIFNSSMYTTPADEGTYALDGSIIKMTRVIEADYVQLEETTSSEKPLDVGAMLNGNELTLSYKSGTETYTK